MKAGYKSLMLTDTHPCRFYLVQIWSLSIKVRFRVNKIQINTGNHGSVTVHILSPSLSVRQGLFQFLSPNLGGETNVSSEADDFNVDWCSEWLMTQQSTLATILTHVLGHPHCGRCTWEQEHGQLGCHGEGPRWSRGSTEDLVRRSGWRGLRRM